jgi:alpha-N-arabinofuranosidase
MKLRMIFALATAVARFVFSLPAADLPSVEIVIHAQPLHEGKIDPKLFGNFIELLDDVVPGMWAEMLNDRSFEGVSRAANWCYYDGSLNICDREWDQNPSWTYENSGPFNGSRSARISATAKEPGGLSQSALAVKKGMDYIFSGYFKTEHATNLKASVLLKVGLPTEEWLTLGSANLAGFSNEWQKQTLRISSRGNSDRVVFELHVEGEGQLWADKLSLMPADNQDGWRDDVIDVTKHVRPSIVRWGGSVVDPGEYRWKKGIGDRDQRIPFRNKIWGRIDSNDVGIDEFCRFCELTKVEPLICVSFSDGAQSAADLVEYCNGTAQTTWGSTRAANGHPLPYGVKFWQVANEIGGDDPKYLDQIIEFAHLMKKADANLAILSSFPTQKLLDRAGSELAYIAPHHYTPDVEHCDREFTSLARMIDKTPGCGHLKIAVTEWNIDAGSWGLGRGKQMTLMAALMNARYLHVIMRHSDKVEIACRSNMANSFCGAIYETSPGGFGVLKRPSYYVMQLYATHTKPLPLTVERSTDALDILACASLDKKSITLFAVNTKTKVVNCSIRFDGFGSGLRLRKAEAVCDVANVGQPDVMNHWNSPERVKIAELPVSGNSITIPPLTATALQCDAN